MKMEPDDIICVIRSAYVFRNAEAVCNYVGESTSHLRLNFLTSINKLQKYQFKYSLEYSSIYLNFGEHTNLQLFQEMTDGELPHEQLSSLFIRLLIVL